MKKLMISGMIAAVLSSIGAAPAVAGCAGPTPCRLNASQRAEVAAVRSTLGPPSSGTWSWTLVRVDGTCTLTITLN
jgi:hypothetical protein